MIILVIPPTQDEQEEGEEKEPAPPQDEQMTVFVSVLEYLPDPEYKYTIKKCTIVFETYEITSSEGGDSDA